MPAAATSEELRNLDFFAGLPDTLLWHLARAAEKRSLAVDELLFRAGEDRKILAILLTGSIAIEQQSDGRSVEITQLEPGDVIGESILLEDSAHGTFGRATAPTTLFCFQKAPLMKLLKDQPALYAALLGRAGKIMGERIKSANATLLGIRSDAARVRKDVERWIDDVEALAKDIGYEKAMTTARAALAEGRPVREVAPK